VDDPRRDSRHHTLRSGPGVGVLRAARQGQKQSAGKTLGTSGAKRGNVHLKWAVSEAAVLFLRPTKDGKTLLASIAKKHGQGEALSILAHKIGRAVFYLVSRGTVFSPEKFRAASREGSGASPTSNSSHGTELAQIAPHACATKRPEPSIVSHRYGSERV
jgi:hypothetical protein